MVRIHRQFLMAGLVTAAALLTACGAAKVPDKIENSSLIIREDGSVTAYVVDLFDKDYYDIDELARMAREEVAAYNTEHSDGEQEAIQLGEVERLSENGDAVIVSMEYNGAESYKAYNGKLLFYGTVAQARQEGFDFSKLNQVLYNPKRDKSMVSSDLTGDEFAKKHVILLDEQTRVYAPLKVAYMSENAKALEDGSIDTAGISEEEYPVIIVLDK